MTIIDKLRELEAKATCGPWEYQPDPEIVGHKEPDVLRFGELYFFVTEPMQYLTEGDWRFIAAMRNALPALLRVAEAAKHAREVQSWGQVPRQVHEGEANQELDDALAALEVG